MKLKIVLSKSVRNYIGIVMEIVLSLYIFNLKLFLCKRNAGGNGVITKGMAPVTSPTWDLSHGQVPNPDSITDALLYFQRGA